MADANSSDAKAIFELRHSFRPFYGITIIIGIVSAYLFYLQIVSPRLKNAPPLYAYALCAYAVYITYSTWLSGKNKIILTDDIIISKAFNKKNDVEMSYDDIKSVKIGSGGAMESYAKSVPFRSLNIKSRKSIIYVSLKRFKTEDIHKLISIIKTKRPDLKVPNL